MGEPDSVRLGHKPKQTTISVETPWPTLFDYLQSRLIVAIEEFVGDFALRILVREFQRLGAIPLHVDNRGEAIGKDAVYRRVGKQVFEARHVSPIRL